MLFEYLDQHKIFDASLLEAHDNLKVCYVYTFCFWFLCSFVKDYCYFNGDSRYVEELSLCMCPCLQKMKLRLSNNCLTHSCSTSKKQ